MVIDGGGLAPWSEEAWAGAAVGQPPRLALRARGPCARCAALRADRLNPTGQPRTATRGGALSALARRGKGRGATFGVLMDIASILDQSETTLRVGDALRPELIHPKAGA